MRDWLVLGFRLTAFGSFDIDQANWFEAVAGTVPASETRTRQVIPSLDANAQLPGGDASITLHVDPFKVDWRVLPQDAFPPPNGGEPRWANLGALHDVLASHGATVGNRWLPIAPAINRLAVGVTLVHPTGSRDEAYTAVSELLPFGLGEGLEDLVIQVNRPVRTEIGQGEPVTINRLVKLASIIRSNLVLTGILAQGQANPPSPITVREQFGSMADLDINTDAQREAPFESGLLQQVYARLLVETESLAQEGVKDWFTRG